MISCNLKGGLGNQLFQIAAAFSLSKNLSTELVIYQNYVNTSIHGYSFDKYKNNIFSKIILSKEKPNLYLKSFNEKKFSYEQITLENNQILDGYFQSEKYFIDHKEDIKKLFEETEEISSYINKKYSNIDFNNSISLHVRRGDYLRYPKIHPVCDIEYYKNALQILNEDKNILLFSDDVEWCKHNLKFKNLQFINNEQDYIDLYLMSRCSFNVIANSTFSWWSAWLNKNKQKKVICPIKWFGEFGPQDTQDLFPEDWIKI
jgi:hypothetical protein